MSSSALLFFEVYVGGLISLATVVVAITLIPIDVLSYRRSSKGVGSKKGWDICVYSYIVEKGEEIMLGLGHTKKDCDSCRGFAYSCT